MRSILLTGACGFLGRRVAESLARRGHRLVTVDLAPEPPLVAASGRHVPADVTDADGLIGVMRDEGTDVVVHLAAFLTDACARDPVGGTAANCAGAAAVCTAAVRRRVRRVVYASSLAAVGPDGDPDRHILRPRSVYGATRAFAEHLARALQEAHPETTFLGIRLGWVYGYGRARGWTAVQHVIEQFALEAPEVSCPDFGGPIDWTYIDDAAEAVGRCVEEAPQDPGAVYNVTGELRSLQDAVACLSRWFPRVRVRWVPSSLPPSLWWASCGPVTAATGFAPRVTLHEGLWRTVNDVRRAHGLPQIAWEEDRR
jgi:UDP-glucose 4-epimerase